MNRITFLIVACLFLTLNACSKDEPAVLPSTESAPVAKTSGNDVLQTTQQVTEQVVKKVEESATTMVQQAKSELSSGQMIYAKSCVACHGTGLIGAPKTGDKKAWSALIAEGQEELVRNSINGVGKMPAKGGNAMLTDAEVQAAVEYMIEQSK